MPLARPPRSKSGCKQNSGPEGIAPIIPKVSLLVFQLPAASEQPHLPSVLVFVVTVPLPHTPIGSPLGAWRSDKPGRSTPCGSVFILRLVLGVLSAGDLCPQGWKCFLHLFIDCALFSISLVSPSETSLVYLTSLISISVFFCSILGRVPRVHTPSLPLPPCPAHTEFSLTIICYISKSYFFFSGCLFLYIQNPLFFLNGS